MRERRYPNESQEYRNAREALLKDERELVDKVKAVAEKRRQLPPAFEPRSYAVMTNTEPGVGSGT